MQAYDSVVIDADVELGGTDQTFNLLAGRGLMKEEGLEPQIALTTPMLAGVDGVEKMSKSLGNHVGITDEPNEMFGKVMSIPDSVMREYFNLLSTKTLSEVDAMLSPGKNPRDAKVELAREMVARFHGVETAAKAVEHFEKVFSRKELPESMPFHAVSYSPEFGAAGGVPLVRGLLASGLVTTSSAARTLVQQGAVDVDGKKVTNINALLPFNRDIVFKIGKKAGYSKVNFEGPPANSTTQKGIC
jgi:tyrosyl-tRNA synthetase